MMSGTESVRIAMRIGGEWRQGRAVSESRDPYRGDLIALAPEADERDVADAVAAAQAGSRLCAEIPAYERAAMLRRVADLLARDAEPLAQLMARETGKALIDCRSETSRAPDVFRLSAEEAVRIEGEHVPLDASAMGVGKLCVMLRYPVGVVAAITPFNAPLNLACHKVAPAIAAGNAVVLKGPPQAPLVVHRLAEIMVEAGVPDGIFNTLYGQAAGPALVAHPGVDFISFTGSTRAGAAIKAASGLRRVALELGGTGSTIVHDDADVRLAASLCARNSMRLAGQSCISVQNIFVHRSHVDSFTDELLAGVAAMRVGDPVDPQSDVGTLIDEAAAVRVEGWVREAVGQGAKLLCGGGREGAQMQPTVLARVPGGAKVVCEEVFGPVCSIVPFDDPRQVVERLNASPFGLQTGVFTRSLDRAREAVRTIRSGGVILNATSTWRTDQMPYGGLRSSGIGREGPRYAIRDMTEERLFVL
jgi:acyl-CoA reductase-like NAD-dependent aldehyde dehydrogenase